MTEKDITVGRCYQAKRPAPIGLFNRAFNDRQVLWINESRTEVQYDSPTVNNGRHYPKVSMEKFIKWAFLDVTHLMPDGDWRQWT